MHTNTMEFVRPGRATHAWVARTVAELKGGDPLAPVTLVVPNYYAGRQIRWTLAMAGGYVNVRSMLLGDVAEQIVGVDTTAQEPLTPVLEQSAVRQAHPSNGRRPGARCPPPSVAPDPAAALSRAAPLRNTHRLASLCHGRGCP